MLGFMVAVPIGQESVAGGFLIALDFAAIDEHGRPVVDLRPEEVVLRVGRETAEVRGLRFLPATSDAARAATRSPGRTFGAAEAVDFDRSFLLVVDHESLPQGNEQSTREAISSFVRRLSPRDRVGLVTVPHGGVRVPVTTDHSGVLQSVQRVSGRAPTRESAPDAACRARNVLQELDVLLSKALSADGPAVLVLFSGSMYDGGGAIQAPLGTPIGCDLQVSEFQQLGVRTAQSRTYTYIVQPETFVKPAWTSNPRSGLEQLAGATGGRIVQLSGRDVNVLDRVRLEMSGLYAAQARIRSKPRSGSTQAISIKVHRPGVTIIARPHLAIPSSPQSAQ